MYSPLFPFFSIDALPIVFCCCNDINLAVELIELIKDYLILSYSSRCKSF